jgi:hypothetical protein
MKLTVSSLSFTFYENGKDHLWVEVEIRNLPKDDRYIVNLIKTSLSKIGSIEVELYEEKKDYDLLVKIEDEGTENNIWPYERRLCNKKN